MFVCLHVCMYVICSYILSVLLAFCFSETESKNLRDLALSAGDRLEAYFTTHAYSEVTNKILINYIIISHFDQIVHSLLFMPCATVHNSILL